MKLIKKSALALMLGALILASAASASSVTIFGGTTSKTANGGATNGLVSQCVYNDLGTGLLLAPDGIDPITKIMGTPITGLVPFETVLTETITATADVPSGVTGDATASFTTPGVTGFKNSLTGIATPPTNGAYLPGAYISTKLDGTVKVSATKTSVDGAAHAFAGMQAQSAATASATSATPGPAVAVPNAGLGGTAILTATASQSGVGTVIADANGEADHLSSLADAIAGYSGSYSKGTAKGEAKVSGTTSHEESGAGISGTSTIYAGTAVQGSKGYSLVSETMDLAANNGISFAGDNDMQGTLTGYESGETQYIGTFVPANPAATPPTLATGGDVIVDAEANSTMNGDAHAINADDVAQTHLIEQAQTGTDGANAIATNLLAGMSQVTRDAVGGNVKAQASGYITHADWSASTNAIPNAPIMYPVGIPAGSLIPQAKISGATGYVPDGTPTSMQGLGVGAWIQKPFINPMTSSAYQVSTATSGAIALGAIPGLVDKYIPIPDLPTLTTSTARENAQLYDVDLNGMLSDGDINNAVGAFLGVGAQSFRNYAPQAFTAGPPAVDDRTHLDTENSRYGITWLEGTTTNLLPGYWTSNVAPDELSQTSVARTSGLIDV